MNAGQVGVFGLTDGAGRSRPDRGVPSILVQRSSPALGNAQHHGAVPRASVQPDLVESPPDRAYPRLDPVGTARSGDPGCRRCPGGTRSRSFPGAPGPPVVSAPPSCRGPWHEELRQACRCSRHRSGCRRSQRGLRAACRGPPPEPAAEFGLVDRLEALVAHGVLSMRARTLSGCVQPWSARWC